MGYDEIVDIWGGGGLHKTELFWVSFIYISGFLWSMYRIGLFLGDAKFQKILGMPGVPDIFFGGGGGTQ